MRILDREKKECKNDWEKHTNINIEYKFIKLVLLHQISWWVGWTILGNNSGGIPTNHETEP